MSYRRLLMLLLVIGLSAGAAAQTAQEYLDTARGLLFNGTLSGIRQGNAVLDEALADDGCTDCAAHRELLFFHAVSELAMAVVGDDGPPVDSLLEWAAQYDIATESDDCTSAMDDLRAQLDAFEFPENRYGQPDRGEIDKIAAGLLVFLQDTGLVSLNGVIDELEQITETPEDRFRVFIEPEELAAFQDFGDPPLSEAIEVDYGEVLMLRGILYVMRGMVTARSAYDTHVDAQDRLIEKVWEDSFSIENDLLLPHPDFLKLLPTANDPTDGAAVMAQSRQDILAGLGYYTAMMDYLWNEDSPAGTDPQDNELFSLDPGDRAVADAVQAQIDALSDSLLNDSPMVIDGKIQQTYELQNSNSEIVGLTLEKNPVGKYVDGDLVIIMDEGSPLITALELSRSGNQIYGYADDDGWGAYFSGILSEDEQQITDAFVEYWGFQTGSIRGLSGSMTGEEPKAQYTVDVNPVFGHSPRYPEPISPRELAAAFSDWNKPLPGTLPDPTMGGVLPDFTQADWNDQIDPQPDTRIPYWPVVEPWQMAGGYPGIWLADQLLFEDAAEAEYPDGTDILELYMGYDADYLYGCVVLSRPPSAYNHYMYDVILSYCPLNAGVFDSLKFSIHIDEFVSGSVYHRIIEEDSVYWDPVANLSVYEDGNMLTFRVPFDYLPTFISGRYITVNSAWGYGENDLQPADENATHIQVGASGGISGTVSFPGHRGGPIFVQAFTDPADPEESLVAYTMLDEPGSFTLDSIGLGFAGMVRAFSPLSGEYHLADMEALKVQDSQTVQLNTQHLDGVALNLQVPDVLANGVWVEGVLDPQTKQADYFAFDAIEGQSYTLRINRTGADYAELVLLDRNGYDELTEIPNWQTQRTWTCPVSGRYYIKAVLPAWYTTGGSYSVMVSSYFQIPAADISGPQWDGVKDGQVDFYDVSLVAGYWLSGCAMPYWCDESDFDQSGGVDLTDLMTLLNEWMVVGEAQVPDEGGDDFETGDFSAADWQFSGHQDWTVVSDTAYQGLYSARSGAITHNQTSELSITADTTGRTAIRFAFKTSSESHWDYLRFYVDGVQQAYWSGLSGWHVHVQPVSEGLHTFTWAYTKDGSVNSNQDCVWIDAIEFE